MLIWAFRDRNCKVNSTKANHLSLLLHWVRVLTGGTHILLLFFFRLTRYLGKSKPAAALLLADWVSPFKEDVVDCLHGLYMSIHTRLL